jgi:hypothetical protein
MEVVIQKHFVTFMPSGRSIAGTCPPPEFLAKVQGNVTIIGYAPNKMKKAMELGIRIMTIRDLEMKLM